MGKIDYSILIYNDKKTFMLKCNLCNKEFKNLGGLNSHIKCCEKTIELKDKVIEMYKNDYSIKDIYKQLSITKSKISEYIGDMVRSRSESTSIGCKKYPHKHTEETKNIIREKHIKWMKEHPEKTAWRLSNLSYPEKLFLNKIKELEWDKKYLIQREKPMFPFYIDFAFNNEKVAVEIDGSQHLEENRKKRDEEKDKLLIENGWMVLRFSDKEIKTNIDNCFSISEKYLKEKFTPSIKKVGIIEERKKYIKKERNGYKFTEEEIKGQMKQRKVNRPSYEELIKMINEKNVYQVSKTFNVSFHTIKKWIKYYQKYELK
jgi:very-short-patch-repair endonuclease